MSKEEFQATLAAAPFIALASSVDDVPNVRLMDVMYDSDTNTLLFPTSRKTPKAAEFAQNGTVAFTTMPSKTGLIRVQNATVEETDISVDEIKDRLIEKRPHFSHLMKMISQDPVVYRIRFTSGVLIKHGVQEIVEF